MIKVIDFRLEMSGDAFTPNKFQKETGLPFSDICEIGDRVGKIISEIGSAKIVAEEQEDFLSFLQRLATYNRDLNRLNIEKYGINDIVLYVDCEFSGTRGIVFDYAELQAFAALTFIDTVEIREKKRDMRYRLYDFEQVHYDNRLNYLREKLKEAREKCEMSLQDVAEKNLISAKQLQNIENGESNQKIDFFLLYELAKLYKKPLDFFYYDSNFYR